MRRNARDNVFLAWRRIAFDRRSFLKKEVGQISGFLHQCNLLHLLCSSSLLPHGAGEPFLPLLVGQHLPELHARPDDHHVVCTIGHGDDDGDDDGDDWDGDNNSGEEFYVVFSSVV